MICCVAVAKRNPFLATWNIQIQYMHRALLPCTNGKVKLEKEKEKERKGKEKKEKEKARKERGCGSGRITQRFVHIYD